MALYAAIGAEFKASIMSELDAIVEERLKLVISRTLKQVAHDYELDYKELKVKYCSKVSLADYELPGQTQQVTVDLDVEPETEPEAPPKPKAKLTKAPKVADPKEVKEKQLALSKMKKGDLVAECEARGLDSEGTLPQLKERVKEARDAESPPKKPRATSKPKAVKPKPPKVKEAKVKAPEPPPKPVEELEEEGEDEEEQVCRPCGDDEEFEEEFEGEKEAEGSVQERLRAILAEAEEEEDFEDEE